MIHKPVNYSLFGVLFVIVLITIFVGISIKAEGVMYDVKNNVMEDFKVEMVELYDKGGN